MSKAPESKVSDGDLRVAVKAIRGGKSSIDGEARRLGCYHATLRRRLREFLGYDEYDRLMWGDRKPVIGGGRQKPRAEPTTKHEPAQVKHVHVSTLCQRCGHNDPLPGTDGLSGIAILICRRCGSAAPVVPRRPSAEERRMAGYIR